MRLLLLEDDEALGGSIRDGLADHGFTLDWVKRIDEARERLKTERYDLALLDVLLPDGSGLELARELKASSAIPIVFLSAVNTAEHRLAGFELGGAEFIPKPFFLKELLIRIERVLQRDTVPQRIESGGFELDRESYSVRLIDGTVRFPAARDFQLLVLLMEAAPRVVAREEIIEQLWQGSELATYRTIDNAIVRLRQLLGNTSLIRSVRSVGYQWIPQPGPQSQKGESEVESEDDTEEER